MIRRPATDGRTRFLQFVIVQSSLFLYFQPLIWIDPTILHFVLFYVAGLYWPFLVRFTTAFGMFKVSWYPKIDHVFEKYTSVIFR